MLQPVLKAYGINSAATVNAFGSGLINNTWKIVDGSATYILQRINTNIFKDPYAIANNIEFIGSYLQEKNPAYLFPVPVKTIAGHSIYKDVANNFFRIFPFVKNSHTVDVLTRPEQAYEAAAQFGKFTKLLTEINISDLKITLPDFHNLSLRFDQFEDALVNGNNKRISNAEALIESTKKNQSICGIFESIKTNPAFIKRVTHHDTKISNVLFDEKEKGLCVIDLDTVMPGYFISDAGDMMRTYLSPVSEEEKDFSKIKIREPFFEALAKGYLGQMKDVLSKDEVEHFVYAGKFMIYMQALRFLTDYINNDVYYGAKYEDHNLVRAGNQFTLLQRLIEKEQILQAIVQRV